MHILMLLSNAYRPDPRVERAATALVQGGHQVTLLCWDRQAELPSRESQSGIEVIRVHNVPSGYGSGWRQVLFTPRFWRQAVHLALPLSPAAVHSHDLDTLYAGWHIKKRLACPLVYDAHEHYPALMSLYLPGILVRALTFWERYLLKQVDATITASTVLRDEFLQLTSRPVIALGNYQDLACYTAIPDSEIQALRARLGVAPGQLLVAYIGGFSRNREILPLIHAAQFLPDVEIHLWGDGHQKELVQSSADLYPNVTYHGWLPHAQVPLATKAADVIYYGLRIDYPGAIYNAPNTLTQAMAAGRPIVANEVGDLGSIIRATKCGLLVQPLTPETIAQALISLRDPGIRHDFGTHGFNAAQTTYNVQASQATLIQLYQGLFHNAPGLSR